jgi:hypothetical protein
MPAETRLDQNFPTPGVANGHVVIVAVGLMVMMLLSVVMLVGLYTWWVPQRALPPPRELPAPQVRTDERSLRRQIEDRQTALLSGYHWVDAGKTLIAIPIGRAMQILAARSTGAYDPIIAPGTIVQPPGPAAASTNQSPALHVPSNREPPRTNNGRLQQ